MFKPLSRYSNPAQWVGADSMGKFESLQKNITRREQIPHRGSEWISQFGLD